jgi:hypothetical protein
VPPITEILPSMARAKVTKVILCTVVVAPTGTR